MTRKRYTYVAVLAMIATVTFGCATTCIPDGTPVVDTYEFTQQTGENPPKMLLFTSISPQWYMYKADYLADMGVKGSMMNGIMHSWDSDIWELPNVFVPDAPKGRIVGEGNPLFDLCKQMNEVCAERGITENSIKVAYYNHVPDWFDDAAWAQAAENFRQGAIFARDAGFRGITLDIEYVGEMYNLDWSGYDSVAYTRKSDEEMLAKAEQRGYEIMVAMIDEFPDMVNWHLPESVYAYGPIARTHVRGMIRALAERDAPGGFHISSEWTYQVVSPKGLLSYYAAVVNSMQDLLDDELMSYWNQRCSINPGLWPLGYYHDVLDDDGNRIGYTGKDETFHGEVVGSYSDKSNNYSVDDFRNQFGTVVTLGSPYFWIYCHGQVLWQMTEEEKVRFYGSTSDILPVDENLSGYIDVMTKAQGIASPHVVEGAALALRGERPSYVGVTPAWRVSGIYPGMPVDVYRTAYTPEIDLDSPEITWKTVRPEGDGLIDLRKHVDERPGFLAYGTADFELDEATPLVFRFGSNDWGTIFLDGKSVFEYAEGSGRVAEPDQDNFVMNVSEGRHTLTIKCGDLGGSAWWYFFRITDLNGESVEGLNWITE
jgi:hypothetical protein